MTTDRPTTLPPEWAESLLRLLLAAKDRDSVSGDLLEEYRQSIVPARGAGADRWYLRQVAWYVLRATAVWSVLIGAICVTRYLFDTLAPIQYTRGVVALRSAVMSWALIGTFASAGAWQTWRSGDTRSGLLVSALTALVGSLLAQAGTLVCLAIWHDPEIWRAIEGSGGTGELWGLPVQMMLIGSIVGSFGSLAGGFLYWSSRRLGIKQDV